MKFWKRGRNFDEFWRDRFRLNFFHAINKKLDRSEFELSLDNNGLIEKEFSYSAWGRFFSERMEQNECILLAFRDETFAF